MLCYVLLCYVMLCYIILYYIILYYIILYYIILYYIILSYIMLSYIILYYIIVYYIILYYIVVYLSMPQSQHHGAAVLVKVGKSFRNEIAPRQGLTRQREFTQAPWPEVLSSYRLCVFNYIDVL